MGSRLRQLGADPPDEAPSCKTGRPACLRWRPCSFPREARSMARPEKVAVVEEIRTKLSESDATVLTEYRGLTVHELADLRGSLRGSGTEYKVFKNTLARRAVAGAGLDDITSLFEG